jgi:hypothetical protein
MKPLTIAALIALLTVCVAAQTKRLSGGGGLSPTVAVTFEGWDGKLDLLVLWRGTVAWLPSPVEGPGYPNRVHAVSVQGRRLELRIDENNIAHIQDQSIPLQGANVLMLDDVDGMVRVAGTLSVDPQLNLTGSDPIMGIVTNTPVLADFVKR